MFLSLASVWGTRVQRGGDEYPCTNKDMTWSERKWEWEKGESGD